MSAGCWPDVDDLSAPDPRLSTDAGRGSARHSTVGRRPCVEVNATHVSSPQQRAGVRIPATAGVARARTDPHPARWLRTADRATPAGRGPVRGPARTGRGGRRGRLSGRAARPARRSTGAAARPALADIESEVLRGRAAVRLAEARLQAEERRIDAGLHLGRGAELVSALRELTAAHPFRERFWAQLMLALYRSGRQAEALEVFRDAARLMNEELGVSPSAELQTMQQRILQADPALLPPPARGHRPRASCHPASPTSPAGTPNSTGSPSSRRPPRRRRWPRSTGWPVSARPRWPSRSLLVLDNARDSTQVLPPAQATRLVSRLLGDSRAAPSPKS
ncbi:AfsR/SARP family transcriptional regulator [Amycolatopsis aidingensis]|uniref:AfsR/SARP family transcriptional regulator n=1 Tax=Amycolatopsis aidingensis TaxID=2842453 RepID=UPI001C0E402C|nr:AfsR/SARP family transcriptional regulator [Amycolatopsis aidingensis]